MSHDDGIMSRWSRRKAAVAQEAEAEAEAERAEAPAPVEDKPEAEVLAELGLQDPDEMDMGDDFSGFMKSAVPAKLRNRALRKLWLTNPALANIDGLVDYGEDFTDASTVVEKITTAYQVGKGYLAKIADDEEKGTESDELADPLDPSELLTARDEQADEFPEENARIEDEEEHAAEVDSSDAVDATQAPHPRKRMNFTF